MRRRLWCELAPSGRGLCRQTVELFGHTAAPNYLAFQLSFLEHVHEFNTGQGRLRRVKRFEAQHRPDYPLHPAVILFHNVVEVLHLTDYDCGVVILVVALDG